MKVYVGNLPKQMTEPELRDLATPFGTLLSASIAARPGGESRGFGFLEFGSDDEAKAAITGLDGREVKGQALKVNESKPRKDVATI